MASRLRAKGRRGGEKDRFAMLPESVMESEAVRTMPHAALRVLVVLLIGKGKERNGSLACSQSYAARFGMTSADTVFRALADLQQRGLIEITRRVQKLKRFPTLYRVTWWPNYYRDGDLLATPEPATHAYSNWVSNPATGLSDNSSHENPSIRPPEKFNPTAGLNTPVHQSDLPRKRRVHQSDSRMNSYISEGGARSPSRNQRPVTVQSDSSRPSAVESKIEKLIHAQPHLTDADIARVLAQYQVDATHVARVRAGGAP